MTRSRQTWLRVNDTYRWNVETGYYGCDNLYGNIAGDSSLPYSYPFEFRTGYSVVGIISDVISPPGTRPYNAVTHVRSEGGLSRIRIHGWFGGAYSSFATGEFITPVVMLADGREASIPWGPMLTELASRIRDSSLPGSQLLVTLAELEKTIQMVKNPFGLLKKSWRKEAGNLTAATLASKGANLWLEGRYGWQAMLYDLKGFAKSWKTYNRLTESPTYSGKDRFSMQSVTSTSSSSWVGMSEGLLSEGNGIATGISGVANSVGSPWLNTDTYGVRVFPKIVKYCVGCKASMALDHLRTQWESAQAALHCKVSDILPTLWELTPYSFVVDWFINTRAISGILQAQELLRSASCTDLGYSIKETTSFVPFIVGAYWGPWRCKVGVQVFESPIDVSLDCVPGKLVKYTRFAGLPGLSLAQFAGTDLSLIHKADGIGLIIQKLHR